MDRPRQRGRSAACQTIFACCLRELGREDALARSNSEPWRHRCRTCSRRIAVSAEISILKAIGDPRLFGSAFKDISTWRAWMAFLAALFGIALSRFDQADTFRACTARSALPEGPFAEAWLVCGRRSGKSFIMALIAVFLAGFRDYRPYLGPGEKATIMVIAADRRQAEFVLRYVRGAPRVSAQILPGPQSDRAGLRQVQDFACERPKPDIRRCRRRKRRHPRSIPARRMRRLCEKRRIRVKPNADRSRRTGAPACALPRPAAAQAQCHSLAYGKRGANRRRFTGRD